MLQNLKRDMVRRTVALIAMVLIATVLIPVEHIRAQQSHEVPELIGRWNSMSDSIVTTKLKCRHLTIIPNYSMSDTEDASDDSSEASEVMASPSRRQFDELFHMKLVPLVDSEDSASAIERETALFLKSIGATPLHWWEELEILDDGTTLRNESRGASGRVLARTRSASGERRYSSDENQATITDQQTSIRFYSHKDACFIPSYSLLLNTVHYG